MNMSCFHLGCWKPEQYFSGSWTEYSTNTVHIYSNDWLWHLHLSWDPWDREDTKKCAVWVIGWTVSGLPLGIWACVSPNWENQQLGPALDTQLGNNVCGMINWHVAEWLSPAVRAAAWGHARCTILVNCCCNAWSHIWSLDFWHTPVELSDIELFFSYDNDSSMLAQPWTTRALIIHGVICVCVHTCW